MEWRRADISRLRTPEDWRPLLVGIDVVVNAAGVLQDGLGDKVADVQDRAMVALYAAAKTAGLRRIVQISAVGAELDAATEFLRTKAQADAALAGSGIDYVILRPGLVISPVAYGGTALLRGLAAIPGVTPLVLGDAPVQTVWIGDVADAVADAVEGRIPTGAALDLVERSERSLADTVALFRAWLGWKPQRVLRLPEGIGWAAARVADALGWLGWRSPLRTTALVAMRAGVTGDPAAASEHFGRELRSLPTTLAQMPSGPQERWFARLWLLKPLVLAGLTTFWVVSGAIGLAQIQEGTAVLTQRGMSADLAQTSVVVGALADVAVGASLAIRPFAATALIGMIVLSLGYLVAATVVAPDLWLAPLGPMVKVLPGLLLAVIGLAVLEER